MVIYGARAGLSCEHTGPVAVWTLRCGLATTWSLCSVGSLWCHKATACHGDITAMARLPHGSSQVAIGLSVQYVRSIYKKWGNLHLRWMLGKMQYITGWGDWRGFPSFFIGHWQSPRIVLTAGKLPGVRAVQGDREIVYSDRVGYRLQRQAILRWSPSRAVITCLQMSRATDAHRANAFLSSSIAGLTGRKIEIDMKIKHRIHFMLRLGD